MNYNNKKMIVMDKDTDHTGERGLKKLILYVIDAIIIIIIIIIIISVSSVYLFSSL